MDDKEYGKLVERLKGFRKRGPIDVDSGQAGHERCHGGGAVESARVGRQGLPGVRDRSSPRATTSELSAPPPALLGAARRLDLVGKPFVLEGSTVDGKPLDWKKYRGKIVLINFFATG